MKKQDLKVVYRDVSELIPYARNARTHSDEQIERIAASIKEFGWTNPILIDGESGIIAGHGRVLAARKLGLEKVPTIELSGLTEAQKRAYIIADNRLALDAGWDEEMLKLEFAELEKEGFELSKTGFSDEEINEMMADLDREVDGVEDVDTPEPPKNPKTKRGEVWRTFKRSWGGGIADLWLTDPPYNVAYQGKTKDALTIQNDEMDDESFRRFLVSAYSAADSVLKEGAAFYIWHADSEGFNFRGACRDVGWKVRECLIWSKNTFVLGRQDYQWQHEPCLYGWKDGAAHNWYSDRSQTTILEFNRPNRNAEHPTMKPVGLFQYLIGNSTKPGDIVLDSFGGSGTTLIACEQTGRSARILELDPCYCDVIIERWQNLTGQRAVRESDKVAYNDLMQ